MKLFKWIFIGIFIAHIIWGLCSCSQKHWKKRGIEKGWLDTTTVKKAGGILPDSGKADSTIKNVVSEIDTVLNDTCINDGNREQVTKIIKKFIKEYLPAVYPDSTIALNNGDKLRIWFEDGILKYDIKYKIQTILPDPDPEWWEEYWYWIVIVVLVIILIIKLTK